MSPFAPGCADEIGHAEGVSGALAEGGKGIHHLCHPRPGGSYCPCRSGGDLYGATGHPQSCPPGGYRMPRDVFKVRFPKRYKEIRYGIKNKSINERLVGHIREIKERQEVLSVPFSQIRSFLKSSLEIICQRAPVSTHNH